MCVSIYLIFTKAGTMVMLVGKSKLVRFWTNNSTWITLRFEPQASAVKIQLLMS